MSHNCKYYLHSYLDYWLQHCQTDCPCRHSQIFAWSKGCDTRLTLTRDILTAVIDGLQCRPKEMKMTDVTPSLWDMVCGSGTLRQHTVTRDTSSLWDMVCGSGTLRQHTVTRDTPSLWDMVCGSGTLRQHTVTTDTSKVSSNNCHTVGQIVHHNHLGISMTAFQMFDFSWGSVLLDHALRELTALPHTS